LVVWSLVAGLILMHTGSGRTLLIARRKQQRGQANKRLSSILQESCSISLGKGGKLRCENDHSALPFPDICNLHIWKTDLGQKHCEY
jgi:hypothetical protein